MTIDDMTAWAFRIKTGCVSPRRPGFPRDLIVLLLALFAFVCQGVVAQGHVHLQPATRWSDAAGASATAIRARPDPAPANCPICQDLAHAGPTLLSAVASVAPRAVAQLSPRVLPLRALSVGRRFRPWQSRAPPILHA